MPRVLPGWYGAKSCPAGTAGGKLAAAGIRLLFAFTTRPPARPRTSTAVGTATRSIRLPPPLARRVAGPGSGPESHQACDRRWRPAGRSNSNPGRGRRGGRGGAGRGGPGKPGVSGNVPLPTGDGPAWYGSARGGRRDGGGVIHGDGPGGFLNTLCHPFGKGPDAGGDSYSLPATRYRKKG